MIDKNYCMSSYVAFRYIEKNAVEFAQGMHHKTAKLPLPENQIPISSVNDLDQALQKQFDQLASEQHIGILLSGGMDSACLASYLPQGTEAYTFRFKDFAQDELKRAEKFAEYNGLKLHYVDITWDDVMKSLPAIMAKKGAPVHSIEPQIYLAALQAKRNGITKMVIGDAADYVFYGMDGLLSQDWSFDAFVKRSIYIDPQDVLAEPADVLYLYERYRNGDNIDFLGFYDKVITEESYSSYQNAFETAGMHFVDPYENLKMTEPVDLQRTRNGDSKYFVRQLFLRRYPSIALPEKAPMPRPVDEYFKNWQGPTRKEFKPNIDISKFNGNQKWLLFCLQEFLNIYFPQK